MTSLVFLGDTAWPEPNCLDLSSIENALSDSRVIINLEGPILENNPESYKVKNQYKFNLYSCNDFMHIAKKLNIVACCLANNHSTDYLGELHNTACSLKKNGIIPFGTNQIPSFEYYNNEREHIVIGLCSPITEADASHNYMKPHILKPQLLVNSLKKLREKNPNKIISVFIHWGYELFPIPQPADRELAKRLIECGANYVIGHHPHVVQPIEQYGNGLIIYSLGNFALPQQAYRGRELKYGNGSVLFQIGLRISDQKDSLLLMHYDKQKGAVLLSKEIFLDDIASHGLLSPFSGINDNAYRSWYRHTIINNKCSSRLFPVFDSYFGLSSASSTIKQGLLNAKWKIRKLAIQMGIHKPYNW